MWNINQHLQSKEIQDRSWLARRWNERPSGRSLQNTYSDQDVIHGCLHCIHMTEGEVAYVNKYKQWFLLFILNQT